MGHDGHNGTMIEQRWNNEKWKKDDDAGGNDYLHSNDCIDEEEHSHEHTNVRQSFEALHKGVE